MENVEQGRAPAVQRIPSLLDLQPGLQTPTPEENLFYTCPQCGAAMTGVKCKVVCHKCHYFIGCVE